MTIVKYRPKAVFQAPFHELVNEFLGRDIGQFLGTDDVRRHVPKVNIIEREGEYRLEVLAPGYSKEELKMNVKDQVLTISAEHKVEKLSEGERYTRREFGRSSFERSFDLPDTVNAEAIKAEYANGLLSVTIPKNQTPKPKTRSISID